MPKEEEKVTEKYPEFMYTHRAERELHRTANLTKEKKTLQRNVKDEGHQEGQIKQRGWKYIKATEALQKEEGAIRDTQKRLSASKGNRAERKKQQKKCIKNKCALSLSMLKLHRIVINIISRIT